MTKEKRLGRGLAALLGEPVETSGGEPAGPAPEHDQAPRLHDPHAAHIAADDGGLVLIECGAIQSNPYQPRTEFDPKEIASLAQSLKTHDMLQPLLVRRAGTGYQLISGERRLKAAIKAGWAKVPCRVRQVTDREMAELAIVENLQRKDLNAIEKAQSFQRYLDEYQVKQDDLAERLQIDRSSVSNYLRLLELPSEVRQAIAKGDLSASHARALLPLGEEKDQIEFCHKIIQAGMSVRETEMQVSLKIEIDDMDPMTSTSNTAAIDRVKRVRSEHVANLERDLKLALGTKIEIKTNARGRGKLSITFKNNEEFERIYDLLLGAGGAEITSKAG